MDAWGPDPNPTLARMDPDRVETQHLLDRLLSVRAGAVAAAVRRAGAISLVPESMRLGAENLVHYLAVRDVDLRDEQILLAERGLSSLGRAEAHVLATVDAVIARLATDLAAAGSPPATVPSDLAAVGPSASEGRAALDRHAAAALGPAVGGRRTRVMVTLPTEAASDPAVADRFVAAGMSVARINAAHDDPSAWSAMAAHVRSAAARHGVDVRIMVDLPGPKLRTGQVEAGPAVLKIRPDRDDFGRVVASGWFVLRPGHAGASPDADDLPAVVVSSTRLPAVGEHIEIVDARRRRRSLVVVEQRDGDVVVATDRTIYLVPGIALAGGRLGTIERVPERPGVIRLARDQQLLLRLGTEPGHGAGDASDQLATIGVDVPELFAGLTPGARVLFDDGRIETVVERADTDEALLRVVRPDRSRLRAGKGLNVPDLDLAPGASIDDDRAVIEQVHSFADLVALSFVGHPQVVASVHDDLDRLGAADVGVVLKIEHRTAFERLPELLLTALRRPPVAVMVARGDLAVEVGYERLAEVQEEVIWLSEAAHVPVIWATQVLESLAKQGAPTRAEVTDAAWSIRAECVMLNKGPYIAETISFLDDVLGRMSSHRQKRTPMLRRLSIAASAWSGAIRQDDQHDDARGARPVGGGRVGS